MTGQAGLKAGLIGAGVLLLLALLSLLPSLVPALGILGCACCGLDLLAYVGAGVLAGFFLTAPRTGGTGAGAGALAGVIAGVGYGVGQGITNVILQATGISAQQTQDVLQLLEETGLCGPGMAPLPVAYGTGWSSTILGIVVCCFGSLGIGAALGAIGGAIFGAVKPED